MNQNSRESRKVWLTGDKVAELSLLSEYSFDLNRALRALDHAESMNSLESDAPDYLLDFAVMAYWLSFSKSDSRKSLTSQDVPHSLQSAHARVHRYRNRVLAHADAKWVDVAAISMIDRVDGIFTLREPILGTARPNLPDHFVRDLRSLILGVSAIVESRIDLARKALVDSVSQSELKQLWSGATETPDNVPPQG